MPNEQMTVTLTVDDLPGNADPERGLHQVERLHRVQDVQQARISSCDGCMTALAWIITAPMWLCPWVFFKTVRDYERALIFRLGKLLGERGQECKGPGLLMVNPILDKVRVVDLRVNTITLRRQEMMTKDSVTVTVNAIILLQVRDPVAAVLEVDDHAAATTLFASTVVRSIVGAHTLEDLLAHREKISKSMRTLIDRETRKWGVKVVQTEVKDVIIPHVMQRAMAIAAETEREKRAKVINSEGELAASKNLQRAAQILGESEGAMQLRYLQTLRNIASEKNSTILFPMPMNMLEGFKSITQALGSNPDAARSALMPIQEDGKEYDAEEAEA